MPRSPTLKIGALRRRPDRLDGGLATDHGGQRDVGDVVGEPRQQVRGAPRLT